METETIVGNSVQLPVGGALYMYKKGSIPTLVESKVFEQQPIDELELEREEENDRIHEYEDIPPVKKIDTKGRRNSIGVLPKVRRGSFGLSSLLGLKSRPDASPGRDGSYVRSEDRDAPALPPRRSSIAVAPSEPGKGRRKSWATRLQVERKRLSSGGEGEAEASLVKANGRRPSWWNALVPENMLKNRSKSRSVDHGFAAPFDLDSLRSKVEGRFDAVQKDEEESAKRISIIPIVPIKTISYIVRDRDTLTSVAARFDTTPSELTKINRLATNFIFPGQNLLVPDKGQDDSKEGESSSDKVDGGSDTSSQTAPTQERDILETLRPVSPEPPTSPAAPQRFLKINVRHITDGQGVVSGVLLVTPNAVMFDPNVSDTLVLEHGPESYGVIAPMEFVVNAAIYYDIAHMRTTHANPYITRGEKPEIYYMNKPNSPDKDSLVKDETFPELATTGDNDSSDKEGDEDQICVKEGERGGDAFPKAFDRERVTPTNAQQVNEERRRSLLDHHWAVPIKERMSIDLTHEVRGDRDGEEGEREVEDEEEVEELAELAPGADLPARHLVKLSCHDSGIDIRDPLPIVTPINTKKVYSDADIVLSQDWVPPVSICSGAEPPLSAPPAPSEERVRKHAVSFSLDTSSSSPQPTTPPSGDKKNKMLKRLSYPLSWMEGLAGDSGVSLGGGSSTGGGSSGGSQGDSLPTSADSHNSGSVFSKVFNRRSSYGGFGKSDAQKKSQIAPPRLDYRSMVSVDDMPELFASFDKLIPRPARSCDDPPLYLRLRMGRPTNRAVPRSTPLMSYGRKRMRPEYWFSVPRNRVDDLYKFLNHWVPELYGELGDVTARGYTLVDSDTELWDDDTTAPGDKGERSGSQGDMGDLTRESWEVLSMSDELRRALYSSGASVDMEFCPPDLIGATEILTLEHREKICGHLPARAQGYMWSLVFSSSLHGFSLNSLYRKMQRVDSPVMLIIQDTENHVFGALTSCALHPSEHFYGTGESFLFSFCATRPVSPHKPPHTAHHPQHPQHPMHHNTPQQQQPATATLSATAPTETAAETQGEDQHKDKEKEKVFRVWQWTGDNLYFIRGSNDNISIGAGDGKFGLWLDGDLYQGRTQSCTTYGNEPLTTREDFIVKTLECWAFI